jgi:hypothetical protein
MLEAGGQRGDFNGSSTDLSLKGMFIRTQDVFPSGTQCLISVYLTGGIDKIELQMKGTIVRSNDEGMGITFDSMDVDTYSHLKNIVYYNTREE